MLLRLLSALKTNKLVLLMSSIKCGIKMFSECSSSASAPLQDIHVLNIKRSGYPDRSRAIKVLFQTKHFLRAFLDI